MGTGQDRNTLTLIEAVADRRRLNEIRKWAMEDSKVEDKASTAWSTERDKYEAKYSLRIRVVAWWMARQ